jgi:hypothetical protein
MGIELGPTVSSAPEGGWDERRAEGQVVMVRPGGRIDHPAVGVR